MHLRSCESGLITFQTKSGRAIYSLTAAAIDAAECGSPTAQPAITQHEGSVYVRIDLEAASALPSLAFVDVADRVGSVEGRISVDHASHGATLIEAVIPCAS